MLSLITSFSLLDCMINKPNNPMRNRASVMLNNTLAYGKLPSCFFFLCFKSLISKSGLRKTNNKKVYADLFDWNLSA